MESSHSEWESVVGGVFKNGMFVLIYFCQGKRNKTPLFVRGQVHVPLTNVRHPCRNALIGRLLEFKLNQA